MLITKTLKDDLYQTDVIFDVREKIHFPNITTLIYWHKIMTKLEPAVNKLETLNNEEKLIAKQKILDYPYYTKDEKDYLISKINEIRFKNTTTE